MSAIIGLTLKTGNFEIDRAFRIALGDMLGNVIHYQSGLLEQPAPCLVAGLSYPDPWTRDTAFNTWNGAGLLIPEVMKNTLLSCLTRGDASAGMGTGCHDEAGSQVPPDVVSISGQYWDRIIWTIGAWAYYCQNGDRDFLELAFEAVRNSMAYLEENEWDDEVGLFRGGACIHDGFGAYSDIYIDQEGTAIFEWPKANPTRRHPKGAGVPMFALSTNCLYAEAYRLVGLMAAELGLPPDARWAERHQRVTTAIRTKFWQPENRHFLFYLDPWGGCGGRQECLGNAFALLFDIATPEQAPQVIANQPRHPYGPPSIWPEWERYAKCGLDPTHCPPNRSDIAAEIQVLRGDPRYKTGFAGHGGAVWPLIQGIWGATMAQQGRADLFGQELRLMAGHFCRAVQSPEVVHPECGLPYGGLQEMPKRGLIDRWVSCYRQTWSATSYLRLILRGLLGIDWEPGGLRIAPCLPTGIEEVSLLGLSYRNARLDIVVRRGARARRETTVPATLRGAHRLELETV
jgi:glycogen debranching enzyme